MPPSWTPHPDGGLRLDGVPSLDVRILDSGEGFWWVTVLAHAADGGLLDTPGENHTRARDEQDAKDKALVRALAVFPAVIDECQRQLREADRRLAEARATSQTLTRFALSDPAAHLSRIREEP